MNRTRQLVLAWAILGLLIVCAYWAGYLWAGYS